MTGIDQMSHLLGEVSADLRALRDDTRQLFRLTGEVKDEMAEFKVEFSAHDAKEGDLDRDVDGIRGRVLALEGAVRTVESQTAALVDPAMVAQIKGVAGAWKQITDTFSKAISKALGMVFLAFIIAGAAAIGIKINGGQ